MKPNEISSFFLSFFLSFFFSFSLAFWSFIAQLRSPRTQNPISFYRMLILFLQTYRKQRLCSHSVKLHSFVDQSTWLSNSSIRSTVKLYTMMRIPSAKRPFRLEPSVKFLSNKLSSRKRSSSARKVVINSRTCDARKRHAVSSIPRLKEKKTPRKLTKEKKRKWRNRPGIGQFIPREELRYNE